ncbi:MAG: MBL fold metallo-hydrolase, partial [Gammaproteobacteria bacterium]|nr:MBL fold metallo-hydrolase [Gammaproteobacteria bacterium]
WEQVRREDPAHIFSQSWDDSVLPVIEAQQAEIVSPDHEIVAGVQLQPAFGHSPGNVVIDVRYGEDHAVLSGDVMHHPVQIERPDWNSVFDQDRAQAQATREALLKRVANGRTWLIAAHFAGPTALTVTKDREHFKYHSALRTRS